MKLLHLAVLTLPFIGGGCSTNWEPLIQALAQDKNALCIKSVLNGPGFSVTTGADRNWGCEPPPVKTP